MKDFLRQQVHINVQIEGTTNSSFLAELGNIYGAERVLVYKLPQKRFIRLSDLPSNPAQSLLKIGKDLLGSTPFFNHSLDRSSEPEKSEQDLWYPRKKLPPDTAAVIGFFTPSLFTGVLENPFISIILKDPLERMITLYDEWKNNKGDVDWRTKVPFDPELPFIDFAVQNGFANFQSKCLGNRRLGDFDLVGIAECQAGFIAQLKNKDWTGFVNPKPSGFQIEKPKYRRLGITPDFLDQFQALNQMDYAIYQQAKEFMGYC